jgi:hypothetical protein
MAAHRLVLITWNVAYNRLVSFDVIFLKTLMF